MLHRVLALLHLYFVVVTADDTGTFNTGTFTNWGRVLPDRGHAQSTSWMVRTECLGMTPTIGVAHAPPYTAPGMLGLPQYTVSESAAFGSGVPQGTPFSGGGMEATALFGRVPKSTAWHDTGDLVRDACGSFAKVSATELRLDIHLVVELALQGFTATAMSKNGSHAQFNSSPLSGHIKVAGFPVSLPNTWPEKLDITIPENDPDHAIARVKTHEIVYTDDNGHPLPNQNTPSRSGYMNLIHVTLFGSKVADVIIGHVAVLNKCHP